MSFWKRKKKSPGRGAESGGDGQVVSLSAYRAVRKVEDGDTEEYAYRARILSMSKLELLDEMVRFQEERSKMGELSPQMMVRGKFLFAALEGVAETRELQILTRSYRRHLEAELAVLTGRKV